MPSWADLQKKPAHEGHSEPDALEDACADAFSSPAGRRLMDVLHGLYIEHVLPGNPDVRALDRFDAKRQLVRELQTATARGLAARIAKAKPKT